MATIYLGSAVINRTQDTGGMTIICKENPASASAYINTVEIWANTSMTGCIVATFYNTGGNDFTVRDSHAIGNVVAGAKRTFSGLNLHARKNDYIGMYNPTGGIETELAGGQGIWQLAGDRTSGSATFGYSANWVISLRGTATTYAPTVTTQAVTNVAVTTITGNGNITLGEATTRGFCYMVGEAGDPTTANDKVFDTGSFGTGAYSKGITGLTKNTHYRVRAYAINAVGTSYGSTVQTTTDELEVTAQAVESIGQTTATGNGNITDTGGENATKRGICWNIAGNPTVADSKSEEEGSFGAGAFTRPITGLSGGQKYYVKAYAYNSGGYSYSSQVDFTTNTASSYGVHEEENSPTICFYVRKLGGAWSQKYGAYTTDQASILITDILTGGSGRYQIKFTTDVLTGLSTSIMVKLNIQT